MNKGAQVSTAAVTKGRKEKVAKTRLRLWLQLLKSSKQIESVLRERLRNRFDTTLPQFDVMAALYRFDRGLKMSALSSELKVSNGNVTGIVDRLTEDGLTVRAPVDGDRRAMLVKLTRKGREQFSLMAAEHESWLDQILDSISQGEAEILIEQLADLHHSIKVSEE